MDLFFEPVVPGVSYTFAPLQRSTQTDLMPRKLQTKERRADVRLRRGIRTAWIDPSISRHDSNMAMSTFLELVDPQGVANAV